MRAESAVAQTLGFSLGFPARSGPVHDLLDDRPIIGGVQSAFAPHFLGFRKLLRLAVTKIVGKLFGHDRILGIPKTLCLSQKT